MTVTLLLLLIFRKSRNACADPRRRAMRCFHLYSFVPRKTSMIALNFMRERSFRPVDYVGG
jgi:hypothetical protein